PEDGRVRLEHHVGDDRASYEVGTLALVPGVLVRTRIRERPAIEATVFDLDQVLRGQVIAEPVALFDCGPQLARRRIEPEADGISRALRHEAVSSAVRVVLRDRAAHGI